MQVAGESGELLTGEMRRHKMTVNGLVQPIERHDAVSQGNRQLSILILKKSIDIDFERTYIRPLCFIFLDSQTAAIQTGGSINSDYGRNADLSGVKSTFELQVCPCAVEE